MVALVSGALLTGLVSTPHCIGMCGPFAATAAGRPGGTIAWTLGRMTTYAALGAAAGALSGFAATWGVAAAVVAGAFVLGRRSLLPVAFLAKLLDA
ncbi:MAG TPA: sulfite exporter TauE/SafE family protein, partial [Myxococcota bacterium]|nr:sulfite exporter TauE/SafE family protein [Myxococcota bacterium]